MAKKVKDPLKGKKKRTSRRQPKPGVGLSGSTSKMSKAELAVAQRGMSGKQDVSTGTKFRKAVSAEQKKTGEKKSSYTQRKKGQADTFDVRTNKTTKSKETKAKEKAKRKAVPKSVRKTQNKPAGSSYKKKRR